MMRIKMPALLLTGMLAFTLLAIPAAVGEKGADKSVYKFQTVVETKHTPVKDQYQTGTCWCFATVSFLESELLRLGKGEFDLSEMSVVRRTYPKKALNSIPLRTPTGIPIHN